MIEKLEVILKFIMIVFYFLFSLWLLGDFEIEVDGKPVTISSIADATEEPCHITNKDRKELQDLLDSLIDF
jgi:hypothetical protein